jgi:hypothetical protein
MLQKEDENVRKIPFIRVKTMSFCYLEAINTTRSGIGTWEFWISAVVRKGVPELRKRNGRLFSF